MKMFLLFHRDENKDNFTRALAFVPADSLDAAASALNGELGTCLSEDVGRLFIERTVFAKLPFHPYVIHDVLDRETNAWKRHGLCVRSAVVLMLQALPTIATQGELPLL